MNHLTHKQGQKFARNSSPFLAAIVVISMGFGSAHADPVAPGPVPNPSWLPQESTEVNEQNPTEEYPASNAITEFNTVRVSGVNTPPSSSERRTAFQVPSTETSFQVSFADITDPNPEDTLQFYFSYYGNAYSMGFDPITKILTVGYNLAAGETAEVVCHVWDRRVGFGNSEGFISAGFIKIVEIEALP